MLDHSDYETASSCSDDDEKFQFPPDVHARHVYIKIKNKSYDSDLTQIVKNKVIVEKKSKRILNPTSLRFGSLDVSNHFIGRQRQIKEVSKCLKRCKEFVITGGEKIGKTELAKACVQNCMQKHIFENVAWLNAESEKDLMASVRGLARELNIGMHGDLLQMLKKIYKSFTTVNLLLVLDHVKDSNAINNVFSQINNPRVIKLYTSQDDEWGPHVTRLQLDVLKRDESCQLVRQVLNGLEDFSVNEQDLKTLVKELQFHPAKLTKASLYIYEQWGYAEVDYTIADYLYDIRKQ